MTQRTIENTSPLFIPDRQLAGAPSLAPFFARCQPLALEIGCGIGDFIVQLAARKPELNFLAIDIYNKGCIKTCRKVEAAGLGNVRVARVEARHLLLHHCARESLAALYINCPDPWPKKRHRDRRLVNGEFLRMALYVLRPGGDIYFSTDFADYAEQVAGIFPAQAGFVNGQATPFTHELPGYPLSKYMSRFLDQGQPIHYFHYRKEAAFVAGEDLLPERQPGFRTQPRIACND